MRRTLKTVAAIVAVVMPAHAMAAVYDFQSTEISALSPLPVTFSFSINTSDAVLNSSGFTDFPNVSINDSGTVSTGNTVGASFNTDLSSSLFFLIDTSTIPFSSGAGTSILFNTGTFAIADGATDAEGQLTISSASAVPSVPEPSTLALMAAGVSMIGGVIVFCRRTRKTVCAA